MDTRDINYFLRKVKIFCGTYPRDCLPTRIKKRPAALVVNTHPASKPGEHWTAIYLDKDGRGQYFDSYGLRPLSEDVIEFLNQNCPKGWNHNTITLQHILSQRCGQFCIIYIKFRNAGFSLEDFHSCFKPHALQNDAVLDHFMKQ